MYYKQTTSGFTLIEMIVSLALFSVVVTISVGALLVLIASNRQLQDEQAVLTNLSFALDSMTREIRTGSAYVCRSEADTSGNNNIFSDDEDLDGGSFPGPDCDTGRSSGDVHGITIIEGGDSITGATERIVYFHDRSEQALYRRVGSGSGKAEKITSNGVAVVDADFYVTGAEPLSAAAPPPSLPNDSQLTQPAVTIYIEVQVAGAANPKTYPIQTTIVQRGLDL